MNDRRLATALILLLTAIIVAGCNIAGPVAYFIEGPPTRAAQYTLLDRPTIVFVDDRANTIGTNAPAIRRAIAEKVSEDLMVKKLVTTTISPRDAMGVVATSDRHGELMPIDAIGRAVGAEQIIYVQMLSFSGTSDGATPRPTAVCRVRVIDVVERTRLFPPPDTEEASRLMEVQTREIDPAMLRSAASRLKVYQALADETGEQIAKLFYKHEVKELGGSLEPR
jgi:hypothetical protein